MTSPALPDAAVPDAGAGDGADGRQVPEVRRRRRTNCASLAMQAPLMKGLEYLDAEALRRLVGRPRRATSASEIRTHAGGVQAYCASATRTGGSSAA